MNTQILTKRIKHFVDCQSKINDKYKFRQRILSYEGNAIILHDKIANDYDELINSLLKNEEYSSKFSEKFLNKKIQQIVIKYDTELNEQGLKRNIEELFVELDTYDREFNILVPIRGVVVQNPKTEIGNTTLFLADESFLKELDNRFSRIISTGKHSEEERHALLNMWRDQLRPQINTILVSHIIVAEPDRAKELAIMKTNQILEVIRLAIILFYSDGIKRNVTIDGEYLRSGRVLQIFETNDFSFTIPSELVGWQVPVELTEENLEKLYNSNISKLIEIISKNHNELNDFEKKILKAVHWYSLATLHIDSENKLLNLITALESVFTVKERGPISSFVPEAVAIILANTLEARKSIKKRINEFYKQRNKITHSGKVSILEQDTNALESFVFTTLDSLLADLGKFSTTDELWEWIEDQRLSV